MAKSAGYSDCESCGKPFVQYASDWVRRSGTICVCGLPEYAPKPVIGQNTAEKPVMVTIAEKLVVERPHKYGAIKSDCANGHTHPSRKEQRRCDELHLMQKAGMINNLVVQPVYELMVEDVYVGKYIGDFEYRNDGVLITEDCKGGNATKTPVYRLKKRIFEAIYKRAILEV